MYVFEFYEAKGNAQLYNGLCCNQCISMASLRDLVDIRGKFARPEAEGFCTWSL